MQILRIPSVFEFISEFQKDSSGFIKITTIYRIE